MGETTDKVKGKLNEAVGNVKQASDDPVTRQEGREQEAKGHGQQAKGAIKGAIDAVLDKI